MSTQSKKNVKKIEAVETVDEVKAMEKPSTPKDPEGVVLNATDIDNELRLGAIGQARKLLDETPITKVHFSRILLAGVNNVSRISSMMELVKSPAMGGLVSSLTERGWSSTEAPIVLQRVYATRSDVEANRSLLIAIGACFKAVEAGIYGRIPVDQPTWLKWLISNVEYNEEVSYLVPVAGIRRSVGMYVANFCRGIKNLGDASYVDARIIGEDVKEDVLTQINVMENTLKNQGLESLGQLDHLKSARELKRRDPFASKTSYVASLGLARATAEKYIEAASYGAEFPLLRLCEITGRNVDDVPTEMSRLVKAFQITDPAQLKTAYESIYCFKGMTSSAEFAALRDGRLAPGSNEELASNLAKYREEFGKWLEERKPSLAVSLAGATGSMKDMVSELTCDKPQWVNVSQLGFVAYLLFKGKILGGGEGGKKKTVSAGAIGDMAAAMKTAGLSSIAPILSAIAEGDEETAKSRAAAIGVAGPAITIVLAMVSKHGAEKTIRALSKLSDDMAE